MLASLKLPPIWPIETFLTGSDHVLSVPSITIGIDKRVNSFIYAIGDTLAKVCMHA